MSFNEGRATNGYGSNSSPSLLCLEGYAQSVVSFLEGRATDGYGTNASLSSLCLEGYVQSGLPPTPPVGKQYQTFMTLPPASSSDSIAPASTNTPAVNGDIWILDLYTALGFAITPLPDGTYQIASPGNSGRDSFESQIWQQSTQSYSTVLPSSVLGIGTGGQFTTWLNDVPPEQIIPFASPLTLTVGVPMAELILPLYVTNVQGDAMTYSQSPGSSLPDGLTFDGVSTISGSPTTAGSYVFQMRATSNVTGAYTDLQAIQVIVLAAPVVGAGFRVMATDNGYYGGSPRMKGDVFDIAYAADYSDSTTSFVPSTDPDYPVYGWMIQVSSSTPLVQQDQSLRAVNSPPKRTVF